MKAYLFTILILSLISCSLKSGKNSTLPELRLLLIDSTTIFNTNQIPDGKPIVLMYFSPDCEHCQVETEAILKKSDLLEKTRFYMITIDGLDRLKVYNHYYHIQNYMNITLAQDFEYSFYNHYKPNTTPYLLIYTKRKKLYAIYIGQTDIDMLAKTISQLE